MDVDARVPAEMWGPPTTSHRVTRVAMGGVKPGASWVDAREIMAVPGAQLVTQFIPFASDGLSIAMPKRSTLNEWGLGAGVSELTRVQRTN